MTIFDPRNKQQVRDAIDLASASSSCNGYAKDVMEPGQLDGVMAKRDGNEIWFAWCKDGDENLFTAITGNGPTSEANARFYSSAREIVIALAEEVMRLRNGR